MGDMSVESLFPESPKRFELGSSGWSWVLGLNAVGGSPYCDFAHEGGVRVASRRAPRPDGYGAFLECPGARAADLGW
jgi:hypothetical protein